MTTSPRIGAGTLYDPNDLGLGDVACRLGFADVLGLPPRSSGQLAFPEPETTIAPGLRALEDEVGDRGDVDTAPARETDGGARQYPPAASAPTASASSSGASRLGHQTTSPEEDDA